jgi:sugar phosphate isomerase/epimerase
MTQPATLPVIGACLGTEGLETFRDWILDKQRDLELQAFHECDVLDGDWLPLAERTRRLLDGYTGRLGIHGPFMGFNIATADRAVQQVIARRMAQGLDVCEALGATQMVIHSPYTPWDHANLDNFPRGRERAIENAHAAIGAAVKRAEAQGVTLVLENIQDIDPGERARLAESFGSAALRLSIDTGHAHCMHRTHGAPPVDYFVQRAATALEHVHLQDTDGYADRHWAPGEGSIPWGSVFRAIAALPQRPRLVLELRDKSAIPAAMRLLEGLRLGQ